MRPSPTTPSVLPATSTPMYFLRSQRPSRSSWLACATLRARASSNVNVCSAAATEFPPGVLTTTTPARVAASRSMLSTPVPARPITRSFPGFFNTSAVTLVAERTTSAS